MIEPIFIGIFGASALLISFFLDLFNIIEETSKLYLSLNIIGGFSMCYYAYLGSVYPFLVLNFVWALASVLKLIGIKRQRFKNNKTKSV